MIVPHEGKPADGMKLDALKLGVPSEFHQTKQAARILDYVDRFIAYFEQAKGRKPKVVHLRQSQFNTLGVQPGKRRKGVRLEVMA